MNNTVKESKLEEGSKVSSTRKCNHEKIIAAYRLLNEKLDAFLIKKLRTGT